MGSPGLQLFQGLLNRRVVEHLGVHGGSQQQRLVVVVGKTDCTKEVVTEASGKTADAVGGCRIGNDEIRPILAQGDVVHGILPAIEQVCQEGTAGKALQQRWLDEPESPC